MRYRSAAFALKSAHALASPGSTHFPARGVDADALLSPAAVLYLLRFAGDIITAEQTFVTSRRREQLESCLQLFLVSFVSRGSVASYGTHLCSRTAVDAINLRVVSAARSGGRRLKTGSNCRKTAHLGRPRDRRHKSMTSVPSGRLPATIPRVNFFQGAG